MFFARSIFFRVLRLILQKIDDKIDGSLSPLEP